MQTLEYAFDQSPTLPEYNLIKTEAAHSAISVSQLLGRDYVFIDTRHTLIRQENLLDLIRSLLDHPLFSEGHTLFTSIEEDENGAEIFTRQEILWKNHHTPELISTTVVGQEQQDFISVIWQCSSHLEHHL